MRLHEWQETIQTVILAQNTSAADVLPVRAALIDQLKSGGIDKNTRVDIYTNAYRLRLNDVLKSNFPQIHQLLGDEDFALLAERYLTAHPPKHASIRWFGECLTDFTAQTVPYSELPVLSELARFEWAFRHTIDAADAERVTLEFMQGLSPEAWAVTVFSVHPSLNILRCEWNAIPIWQALLEKIEPSLPVQSGADWIIYRQRDLMTSWRSSNTMEISLLEKLKDGETFAGLCEALAMQHLDQEQVPAMVANYLRGWIEQGILVLGVMSIFNKE